MAIDFRTATAPAATMSPTSASDVQVGDLVIVSSYSEQIFSNPTHTLQSGFTELANVATSSGGSRYRLSVAYKVATSAGANTYGAYTTDGTTPLSGIVVIKVGSFDLAGITGTTALVVDANPPDPPSITALGGAVIAFGAWFLQGGSTGNTVAVSPPSGYTEIFESTDTSAVDMSAAYKLTSAGAEDPGAFSDDTANVFGTAAITITIANAASASTSGNLLLLGVG